MQITLTKSYFSYLNLKFWVSCVEARYTTTTLFAARNVLDGTVIGQCMARHWIRKIAMKKYLLVSIPSEARPF